MSTLMETSLLVIHPIQCRETRVLALFRARYNEASTIPENLGSDSLSFIQICRCFSAHLIPQNWKVVCPSEMWPWARDKLIGSANVSKVFEIWSVLPCTWILALRWSSTSYNAIIKPLGLANPRFSSLSFNMVLSVIIAPLEHIVLPAYSRAVSVFLWFLRSCLTPVSCLVTPVSTLFRI